jgi:hypothetical protein
MAPSSSARSKLIAETKKGLKHVVKKYGKPSEHKMPKKVGFVHEGTQFEFAIRKVKKKDGTKSKRWVRVVYKSPKPCGQGKKRSEETNRCVNIEPKKRTYKPCGAGRKRSDKTNRCVNIERKKRTYKPKPCKAGKHKVNGRCVVIERKKRTYKPKPCTAGKHKVNGRCVKIERKSPKGPQTARGKKAAATRKIVESRAGKASNMPVGGKWSGMIDGKMQKFVVRMVKNKKRWVRNVNRKKTTKSSGGLQKVQPSKIDPVFSDLGDLPNTPAGLRM